MLFASDLVLAECADGDGASERLRIVDGIDVLQTSAAANALAAELIAAHAVPQSEPRDALHIALAAVNGIAWAQSLITTSIESLRTSSVVNQSQVERM
ncbi:hypothetical protein SH449x_005182 [Pirellulaceae bacterium SH449]